MSNVELKLKDTINDNDIYDIYIDNVYAGGLEANYDPRINSFYIENIKKSDSYKEGHLLEDVVNYLYNEKGYDLGCLPLEKYRDYYEELGFTPFIYNDNDVYYHKIHKGDNMKTDEFLNEVKNIINEDNTSQKNEALNGLNDYKRFYKDMKEFREDMAKVFPGDKRELLDQIDHLLYVIKAMWDGEIIDESSQKNEDISNNSNSLPYVVANSRLQPIEYFEDVRTANDYVISAKKKSGIKTKDLDMFIYQTDDLIKRQIQRYGKVLESSQRNESLDLSKLSSKDAEKLSKYFNDFAKDKTVRYDLIDKIEDILENKCKTAK